MQDTYYKSTSKGRGDRKVFGKMAQGGQIKTWNERNPKKKKVNYRKQFEV